MSSYEKKPEHTLALWQELMSDEENERSDTFANNDTSDEYQPSSSDSDCSEYSEPPPRKKRAEVNPEDEPSTSRREMDAIDQTFSSVIENLQFSDSEEENEEVNLSENIANRSHTNERSTFDWYPADGNKFKTFSFTEESSGFQSKLYDMYNKEPVDFCKLFVNNDILDLIVLETNRYASQCTQKDSLPNSRIQKWTPTNRNEIEKLIGIIIWMGLCPYPSLQSYWQKKSIYQNCLPSIMPRNRFQLLLKMLHFNNNEDLTENRLHKLSPLIEKHIIPSEYVCID